MVRWRKKKTFYFTYNYFNVTAIATVESNILRSTLCLLLSILKRKSKTFNVAKITIVYPQKKL